LAYSKQNQDSEPLGDMSAQLLKQNRKQSKTPTRGFHNYSYFEQIQN